MLPERRWHLRRPVLIAVVSGESLARRYVRACVRGVGARGRAVAGRMAQDIQDHGTNTRSNTNAVLASACHIR